MMQTAWKLRAFMLKSLPAAFFAGLKLEELSSGQCVVSVPYKWMTRNPFRSTYFASLLMAAEMSTGLPAWEAVQSAPKKVSMLVTHVEADFHKKASGPTRFICTQVQDFKELVAALNQDHDMNVLVAESKGFNNAGELVATVRITWSFALKKKK